MPSRLGRPRAIAVALVATVATSLVALPAPPALGATPPACKVTNLTQGGSKGSLQKAVNAAQADDVLRVTGTCRGITSIDKDLTIRGKQTRATGIPTLNGLRLGSVVTIEFTATVTMVGLTIRNGAALGADWPFQSGGGIFNHGVLTLRKVIVKGSRARVSGAGIRSQGATRLIDSVVTGNRITEAFGGGCGIATEAMLILEGTTSVDHNRPAPGASCEGGGIAVYGTASALLYDVARVEVNEAGDAPGGGLFVHGGAAAVLNDDSLVYQNVAGQTGGGAYVEGVLTLANDASVVANVASDGGGIFGSCATISIPAPEEDHVFNNVPDQVSQIC